jgi:hypothetical protein
MELLNRFKLNLVLAVENGTWEANLIMFCATPIDETIDIIDRAGHETQRNVHCFNKHLMFMDSYK